MIRSQVCDPRHGELQERSDSPQAMGTHVGAKIQFATAIAQGHEPIAPQKECGPDLPPRHMIPPVVHGCGKKQTKQAAGSDYKQ